MSIADPQRTPVVQKACGESASCFLLHADCLGGTQAAAADRGKTVEDSTQTVLGGTQVADANRGEGGRRADDAPAGAIWRRK